MANVSLHLCPSNFIYNKERKRAIFVSARATTRNRRNDYLRFNECKLQFVLVLQAWTSSAAMINRLLVLIIRREQINARFGLKSRMFSTRKSTFTSPGERRSRTPFEVNNFRIYSRGLTSIWFRFRGNAVRRALFSLCGDLWFFFSMQITESFFRIFRFSTCINIFSMSFVPFSRESLII